MNPTCESCGWNGDDPQLQLPYGPAGILQVYCPDCGNDWIGKCRSV